MCEEEKERQRERKRMRMRVDCIMYFVHGVVVYMWEIGGGFSVVLLFCCSVLGGY